MLEARIQLLYTAESQRIRIPSVYMLFANTFVRNGSAFYKLSV